MTGPFIIKIKDEKERKRKLAVQRKRYFGGFDELLDKAVEGPYWLKDEQVAEVVTEAIPIRNAESRCKNRLFKTTVLGQITMKKRFVQANQF